ncbi:MAG: CatB-related O-acetyltransferase [Tabrizicola sp.]
MDPLPPAPARKAGLVLVGEVDGTRHGLVGRSRIEVGRFTYGVEAAKIRQWREGASLTFGAFCSVATGLTVLLGGNHRVDWSSTFPFGHIFVQQLGGRGISGHPQTRGDVVIGNDVWLGSNVTILSGVTIGDGAVIAANATVARDVGPYEIWGGNPAALLRPRFAPGIAARLQGLRWWDCSIKAVRQLAPLLCQPPDDEVLDRIEAIVTGDRT